MAQDPKYAQIKKALRRHLRSELTVGSKLPSTLDLQRRFSVSQGTINRAIQDLVGEGLVERRIGSGTFVSDPGKRTAANIGVLWGLWNARIQRNTPYSARILHEIEEQAHLLEKHVLVADVREVTRPTFTGNSRGLVSGVIILFNHDHRLVRAYHDDGLPVVLIDPFVRTPEVPFVTSDDYSASRLGVAHLVKLGHRRIVHVTVKMPVPCLEINERIFGYCETMREFGLEQESHVHTVTVRPLDPDSLESGSLNKDLFAAGAGRSFVEMLERVRPTACCCLNDDVAAWVVGLCHERGIAVPQQMSVVGIDDEGTAGRIWPPLTTVQLPVAEIGRRAVRILDECIKRGTATGSGEVLPVRLIERASSSGVRS